ncbi:MAG: CRISPR-associated endonuclease Cas2 [Flexistipes sinusarabici]|uniref:CRISPR-associated endoribonuclease Cas2 n=1 Tax=Flexistipes sinusarabici TaxID=2352 RepID=A0A5D0MMS2_FLESI|nr:CRISPR-associated endonuclease Cas2 [Flexistipes sinusarabici]TYB33692.1 MAG: CRISPR-associated endonuclease Cas2 [Flexistipes sinusarabici]
MIKKISGYRLMWMMVMFDLPVLTKEEVKEANNFRKLLLGLGFEMAQFSVYTRFVGPKEKSGKYIRKIKENLPPEGKVDIVFFTDKQYENIISLLGGNGKSRRKTEKYLQF